MRDIPKRSLAALLSLVLAATPGLVGCGADTDGAGASGEDATADLAGTQARFPRSSTCARRAS